jgi:hypothetical protein
LQIIVSRETDRGFILAGMATTWNSPFLAQAEKAHRTATILLSKISGLSQGDRQSFESRLKELQSRLDQVATFAQVERYPEQVAS